MIAAVINQTICTAFSHLSKEVLLKRHGVNCKKDLWKPYMTSYLMQSISYNKCEKAYEIQCSIAELNDKLVTTKICTSTSFKNLVCSTSIVDVSTPVIVCGSKATIQQLN